MNSESNTIPAQQSLESKDLSRLLQDVLESSADARFLHRLHCVFLVRQGLQSSIVAQYFNYAPSTVSRWVRQFNESGSEGLKDSCKPGRPKSLSSEQLQRLKRHIAQSPANFGYNHYPAWDGKCLQGHLEKFCAVSLSIRQCQRLLKQLRVNSAQ
ncbi:MAG: helix-turn-helix domain-containing protein [Methyloprofundus sp.]|nr:helix-turn-helix domain-containing protein [Methyloprofundus sp.]